MIGRNSGKRVKFWIFDAYLGISFFLLFVSWSFYMLIFVIISLIFFYALDSKGYTLPNALRRIHIGISGKVKKGVAWWSIKKM